MHTIVSETDSETIVSLIEYGTFIPDGGKQILTIGNKLLKIFRLNAYAIQKNNSEYEPQLECICQYQFISPIIAVTKIRLPGFNFDCIVTCFDDTRITIQYICPAKKELEIVSLHELNQELLTNIYEKLNFKCFLINDPNNRCIISLIRDIYFLIIPIPSKLNIEFFEDIEETIDQQGVTVKRLKPKLTHYEIKLHDVDKRFHNVADFIMLSNQYIPTGVLLYEPKKNASGRAAIEYDTFCIAAVSFDLKEKQSTVTWEIQGFPLSLQKMLYLPEPVNGILLCGVNELIYVHPSAPTYGVTVNSNSCGFSKLKLHKSEILTVFDGIVAEILSPYEVMIGTREGELYIATIDTDAMNSVRNIFIQKAADIPIPSALLQLSRGYVYVASKINNCALYKYIKSIENKILPSSTLLNGDTMNNMDNIDVFNGYNPYTEKYQKLVSQYFYGETEEEIAMLEAPIKPQKYEFTKLQTLLNTAPFKKIVACVSEEIDDNIKDSVRDQVYDIAAATGHYKEGKLLFMERTIRPTIGSSIPTKAPVSCAFAAGRFDDVHRYIFLTREMDTVVLDTTMSLGGNHSTPFYINEGTIVSGDLCDGVVVGQITIKRLLLVKDHKSCMDMIFDPDTDVFVVDAFISDPYIAITLSTNKLIIGRVYIDADDNVQFENLEIPEIEDITDLKTTSLCLYADHSGIFTIRKSNNSNALIKSIVINDDEDAEMEEENFEGEDEISKFLYSTSYKQEISKESNVIKNRRLRTTVIDQEFDNWTPKIESTVPHPAIVRVNHFLILAKEDGGLYFFLLPDMKLVFVSPKTNCLWTTLIDDPKYGKLNSNFGFTPPNSIVKRQRSIVYEGLRSIQANRICEVKLYGVGPNNCRPILGILVDDTVAFYEAFPFDNYFDGHLMIKFKRLDRQVHVRRNPFIVDEKKMPIETISIGVKVRPRYINFLSKMGSMNNVIMITGGYPTVLYVGMNGIYYHPFSIDGPITGICYLKTTSIDDGFVYVKDDVIRIGELSLRYPKVEYDTPYPCRVINMGCNINHMCYLLPFNLFAVDVSIPEEYGSTWCINNDELVEQKITIPENFVLPKYEKHMLRLYTRENYNFIPYTDVEFKDFESITSMEEVLISALGSKTGKMNYIAVGTSFNMGEEVPMRGRLIVYEIFEVVPEANMPTTRYKMKTLAEAEQKGPVSAISSTEGVMMVGVGPRVYMYCIKDEGLVANAFLDLQFYVNQIVPFKSLAVCIDMFTSVHLIRYQDEFKVLSQIASDDRKICPRPSKTGFLLNNQEVTILLSDYEKNILTLEHVPYAAESQSAQRLLVKGGIRIGSVITNFLRVHCHFGDSMISPQYKQKLPQMSLFTTREGGWGYIRPVPEKSYRRILMLQNFIENQIQQLGGLNARGIRAIRPQTTGTEVNFSSAKQMIDADLMLQYFQLDNHDMEEVSRRLGSTKYQILDDLIEVIRTSRHF